MRKGFKFLQKKMIYSIEISTEGNNQMVDITDKIEVLTPKDFSWIAVVYTPHTTCAITINEWYDPDVAYDMLGFLSKLVPSSEYFRHFEWNSHAHIKSSLIWVSETVLIEEWKLVLGRWQKIFFCEFDGPRKRKVYVKFV